MELVQGMRELFWTVQGSIPFAESKTVVMRNYYIGPLYCNFPVMAEMYIQFNHKS